MITSSSLKQVNNAQAPVIFHTITKIQPLGQHRAKHQQTMRQAANMQYKWLVLQLAIGDQQDYLNALITKLSQFETSKTNLEKQLCSLTQSIPQHQSRLSALKKDITLQSKQFHTLIQQLSLCTNKSTQIVYVPHHKQRRHQAIRRYANSMSVILSAFKNALTKATEHYRQAQTALKYIKSKKETIYQQQTNIVTLVAKLTKEQTLHTQVLSQLQANAKNSDFATLTKNEDNASISNVTALLPIIDSKELSQTPEFIQQCSPITVAAINHAIQQEIELRIANTQGNPLS